MDAFCKWRPDMTPVTQDIRTIDLGYDQLMVLDGGRGERVRVLFGATWLTQEDEAGDAILHAGSELALQGGRTLIEALEPTRVQIVRAAGSSRSPAQRLQALWGRAQRQVTRLQLGPVSPEPVA
jgi:hypothetical protein